MNIEIDRIILLLIATFFTVMWILFATKNESVYQELSDSIDENTYKYPELFCVGFSILQILKFDLKSKKSRARIKEIAEVKGAQYAEYHYYVLNAAKWTYGYTLFVVFCILAAMADSFAAMLFGIAIAALLMWYIDERLNDELEERREELLSDFPQILSKMALLVTAGLPVREAWKRIAFSSERAIYKEMQETTLEMNNGVIEAVAYKNFADRCTIKEIRRFSSSMIQALQKGNSEMALFLKDMADEMWEEKKHLVKRKGEAAGSKLLIPMAMIFLGILVMIVVPAFSGL